MHTLRVVLYCCIDIIFPFISFFVLLDNIWPSYNWLIAPVIVLFGVAVVYMYITSLSFPKQPRASWLVIRSSLLALLILLISSGSNWRGGLFQYALVAMIALTGAFGWVILQQRSVIAWIFGGIALIWTVFASWLSYKFYVTTFIISWSGIIWFLWPLWLLIAIPQIKKRYQLIDSFFKKQKRE